jgi:hypothetical protein
VYALASVEGNPVEGIAADGVAVLYPGWNLVSPVAACPVPAHDALAGPAWRWDAAIQAYVGLDETGLMQPGQGYWIHVDGALAITVRLCP